ncbi:glycoside hydrolase family 9 protein [Aquimarina litoralis]|uniref:glycoside hydrolase family 9 protein n=1 Tax=Aquimarina litoralis TaxID=584605 RepID=UPI001C56F026|nr:glycoside hydrolase family 9 protein [Aquimarina litoralis]MBW1295583.1 T9SS type A sorting domain-containing protein [Aquimarina litoralis]
MKKNLLSLLVIFLGLQGTQVIAQHNYGEALQKSILFYESQQSGVLPDWNRVSWRSDAGVNDGQDVGLDLTGGWFDAGDHIKFGFPMAFSVTALNWGFLEYKDGYDAVNQTEHFKRNIKWVTDYFIKCHPTKFEFYAQVSKKGQDHSFWMPAEMVDVHPQYGQRESFKLDTSHPGTEVVCETAAALASASIIFKDSDPTYSATLLQHAKDLYEFGETYKGKYTEEGGIPAVGTYSSGGYEDELTWGALWLYKATGDNTYLQKAEATYGEPDYLWSLVWDDKRYGNMVLLAELTGKQQYIDNTERHLQFWIDNGSGVTYSPGGQAHLTQWGSLRHSMNAALTALIFVNNVSTPNNQDYYDFAVSQVKYALGDNPNDRSLVTGFGVNPPTKPHHRGQHSSWTRSESIPEESRHTLWGALMGGPGSPDDVFVENRSDFQANEVACDYNACYQGVLAKMVMDFGGTELPNFPTEEAAGVEFLNETKINSESGRFTELAIWLNNRSAWPARVPGSLSARYFIDITEGINAGYSPSDYEITGRGNGGATGGLQVWDQDNNIYYVEVAIDSDKMPFPGGQGEHRKEIQVRVSVPNNADESSWDPSNDFSYDGLSNTLVESERVPIYADGELVWGIEPSRSLSVNDFEALGLQLYPNPTKSELYISGDLAKIQNSRVVISGITGTTVKSILVSDVATNQISIPTVDLSSGMYFITVTSNSGSQVTSKFMKI